MIIASLEGIDATGKSTLLEPIASECQRRGAVVKTVPEFDGAFLQGWIQRKLENSPFIQVDQAHRTPFAQLLFMLAAHAHKMEAAAVDAGSTDVLLVDRYIHSAAAYQAPYIQEARSPHFDVDFDLLFRALPAPATVVFLTAPMSTIAARIEHRGQRMTTEDRAFLEAVSEAYSAVLASHNDVVRVDIPAVEISLDCVPLIAERILSKI